MVSLDLFDTCFGSYLFDTWCSQVVEAICYVHGSIYNAQVDILSVSFK